jgi:hypothetical protein
MSKSAEHAAEYEDFRKRLQQRFPHLYAAIKGDDGFMQGLFKQRNCFWELGE